MPDQQLDVSSLPKEISDSETIVRAILTPWHYKNGVIRKQALKPPVGKSDISVMRQCAGDDFCKSKAVEIGAANPKNEYAGLLTLTALSIREAKSEVKDSREIFLGHADLDHGFPVLKPDDPASTPEELKKMDDRIDELLKVAKYHQDPKPGVQGWTGPPLRMIK